MEDRDKDFLNTLMEAGKKRDQGQAELIVDEETTLPDGM